MEGSVGLMQYLPVFIMGSVSVVFHLYLKKQVLHKSVRIIFHVASMLILFGIIISIPGIRYFLFNIPQSDYLVNKYTYIGKLSFPAYLIHWIFLDISNKYIKTLNGYSVFFMIFGTLSASIILNRFVERPLSRINLINKSFYNGYKESEKINL